MCRLHKNEIYTQRTEKYCACSLKKSPSKRQAFVGMRGFEPPISRPPDAHFNRTKLHPELVLKQCKNKYFNEKAMLF